MKVEIVEDGLNIEERYGNLPKHHDVHVTFLGRNLELVLEHLNRIGFRDISTSIEDMSRNADIYLIDGLEGYWQEVVKLLPKDKCYIVSESRGWKSVAIQNGFNYLSISEIEDKLKELEKDTINF